MRVRVACLAAALTLLGGTPLSAGSYGTESPFVAGTGGRASAMGLSATSFTGRPSLQFFNPASLAGTEYRGFEFYRTTLFDSDSQYHAVSYVHPTLNYGAFGATALRLDVGGVEERDNTNTLLGEISNSQTRFLLGYGLALHELLSAGVNLKIDNQSFGGYGGSGVGVDLGFQSSRELSPTGVFRSIRGGLMVENVVEPSIKLDQDDVADPTRLAIGASLYSRFDQFGFVTALNVVSPRFSPTQIRFGQEVDYAGFVALRAGFDDDAPTFGAGGTYRNISVDYAYRSEDLGGNHRISLSVAFGASTTERIETQRRLEEAELQRRFKARVDDFENDQLADLARQADVLYASGDFDRALDRYEMVLVWDPSNVHAEVRVTECEHQISVGTAESLIEQNDYLTAIYHLKRADETMPGDPRVAELRGLCERQLAEAHDRSQMVESVLKRSIDLYAEGRFEEALAGFREVVRLDPNNGLAKEYERKSATNISNAVQRLVLRARARAERGRYEDAIPLMRNALDMAPDNDAIVNELRAMETQRDEQLQRERERRARRAASQDSQREPKVTINRDALDAKYERGIVAFEAGNFERAADELIDVWTAAPDYRNVREPLSRSYLFLGMKLYSQERYDEAIRIWEKILAIDPSNVKAQRYLKKTREEVGRLSGGSR